MKQLTLLSTGAAIALGYAILAAWKKVERRRAQLLKASARQRLLEDVSHSAGFDFVIVGGGTAGCVLASRLTEDPTLSVLLLEAGRSGLVNTFTRIPSAGYRVFKSKDEYGLFTTEQLNAGGRMRYWPRGRMLGGCSNINAMIFHEGAPSDYDEWAAITGDDDWSFRNFKKYFAKFEKFVPSEFDPEMDTSLRGQNGPIEVGFFGHFTALAKAFIAACEALGIPNVTDLNTEKGTVGVARLMTYIDSKGERVTTESAYLARDVLSRPNLTIVTNAHATKILIEKCDGSNEKRAQGVEFASEKDGERRVVKARREVILAAGAIHTPHILLLSGIGPSKLLSSHSISLVHELPGVGTHLMDHVVAWLRFRCKAGLSLNFMTARDIWEKLKLIRAVIIYKATRKGVLTHNVVDSAAFVRSDDPVLFREEIKEKNEIEDSNSGKDSPDIELLASPLAFNDHGFGKVPSGDLCSIGPTLLRPTSKGSITLKSADPFEVPIIDPNYFATKHDLDVVVRGIKLSLRIAGTEPYASLLDNTCTDPFLDNGRINNLTGADSDPELEKIAKDRLETVYHPCCTARMAPIEQGGVVDSKLRVYGIEGLRIADASVFPSIVSGHTAAPVIAIAEKAADLIKNSI